MDQGVFEIEVHFINDNDETLRQVGCGTSQLSCQPWIQKLPGHKLQPEILWDANQDQSLCKARKIRHMYSFIVQPIGMTPPHSLDPYKL